MARKYEMSWEGAPQFRWRKNYRNTTYRVSCADLRLPETLWTQEQSREAANDWWVKKRATVDGTLTPVLNPVSQEVSRAVQSTSLDSLTQLAERGAAAAKLLQILNAAADRPDRPPTDLQTVIDQLGQGVNLPDQLTRLMLNVNAPPTDAEAVAELHQIAKKLGPTVDANKSVRYHADKWSALQQSSSKSAARKKMNCHMLKFFTDFIGAAECASITEDRWQDFFVHLQGKSLDDGYKARILRTARNFVTYLYEMRQLDTLPRNLGNRNLKFKQPKRKVKVADVGTIRTFFAAATGQTRLHVLLGLNCGFTAQDISDLQDSEVDWTDGIITRKRSKTKDEADCPEVTYKLWPLTLNLLREYRSGTATVLLTQTGKPWIQEREERNGQSYKHSDSVASCFKNTCRKAKVHLAPKELRTAAASMLANHAKFKFYHDYFLGHSPRTVSEKHYVNPSNKEFFAALKWLDEQFDLQ